LAPGGARTLPEEALDDAQIREHLARLDLHLDAISRGRRPLVSFDDEGTSRRFPDAPPLMRDTIRSLLVLGSFHDLPEQGRVHPAVQARMVAAMPEMDRAVSGMHDIVFSLDAVERAELTAALRREPRLVTRAAEAIDGEAAAVGISSRRRRHLLSLFHHVGGKLAQSTDAFVERYRVKVEHLSRQDLGDQAQRRLLAARLGPEGLLELEHRTERHVRHWQSVAATTSLASPTPYRARGTRTLTTGAWILGLSALTFGVGTIILSSGVFGGVFVMTLGVLGAIAGLIVLLVGGIIRVLSDARAR